MLSSAAVISIVALVGTVQKVQHKLDSSSAQSICIAQVQSSFDRHIASLVVASIDKQTSVVISEQNELRDVIRRLDNIANECPN